MKPEHIPREVAEADVGAARAYSVAWNGRVFSVTYELLDGSHARSTYTVGAEPPQDQRPKIVFGPQ